MKEKDEPHEKVTPDGIVNNLEEAVDLLLSNQKLLSNKELMAD